MVAAIFWAAVAYLFVFPLVCAVIILAAWLYNLLR